MEIINAVLDIFVSIFNGFIQGTLAGIAILVIIYAVKQKRQKEEK
jgi:hypothetical protein|nr:hypothetical protein [Ruthenibacterium lactatiformans]DAL36820.1 MAG TPA_asm: Protein Tyrosine Kinase [Caudoviricetes sp.]